MNVEKKVKKNEEDIKDIKIKVDENSDRIKVLEKIIVTELKKIGSKVDKLKKSWLEIFGLVSIGAIIMLVLILTFFG